MEAMRQSWSDDRLDNLNRRVEEGFARVDQRFEQMDQRFVEGFARVDQRFEQFEKRFDRLESRFDQLLMGIIVVGGGLIASLFVAVAGG
jgi:hypothetical protein